MISLLIVGFVSGVISGMGIGGGTILIPALVFLRDMPQQQAQITNLIYFVPTAVIALFSHVKNGNIEKKIIKPIIFYGLLGAVIGSILAVNLDSEILKKAFGVFLLFMGIIEINKKK